MPDRWTYKKQFPDKSDPVMALTFCTITGLNTDITFWTHLMDLIYIRDLNVDARSKDENVQTISLYCEENTSLQLFLWCTPAEWPATVLSAWASHSPLTTRSLQLRSLNHVSIWLEITRTHGQKAKSVATGKQHQGRYRMDVQLTVQSRSCQLISVWISVQ